MAPLVVIVASGEIGIHQCFNLLTLSATTVWGEMWGCEEAPRSVGGLSKNYGRTYYLTYSKISLSATVLYNFHYNETKSKHFIIC